MRLFTAVDIPPDIRDRLATLLDQLRPLAKLQWSKPEKLHITTNFIGEWPEAGLKEIHAALAGIHSGPIPISIKGVSWMSRHILAVGVEASPALPALVGSMTGVLTALGVAQEERAFRPHLTLARRKRPRRLPELDAAVSRFAATDFGSFLASGFALFQSHDGKYTQLEEYSLVK